MVLVGDLCLSGGATDTPDALRARSMLKIAINQIAKS
jgi:hypothetical protein